MSKREIKFRAWDGKQMLTMNTEKYGYPTFECKDGYTWLYWNEYDLMQYTGLKDANGREVYEGDIVATHYTGGPSSGQIYNKREVKWGVCDVGCNGFEYEFKVVGPYVDEECMYGQMIDGKVTVIGNIHENPELL